MNRLKNLCAIIGVLFIVGCGENPKNKEYQNKLAQLKIENDSLKHELAKADTAVHLDTVVPKKETKPVVQPTKTGRWSGKHPITLQWISWENPGTATIKPLDSEWYNINGSQKNKAGDYLTINGKIKRLSEKELEFEGIIVTKVSYNNGNAPCVKEGKQTFYAKGNRKYFRLQNIENCEQGNVLDYVDIYTGDSSL